MASTTRDTNWIDRLFSFFDTNGNGTVDFAELASGLSILCRGSTTEKIQAAFTVLDIDRDGVISLDEMVAYFTAVFKIVHAMLWTSQEAGQPMAGSKHLSPEALAQITAEACFAQADLNHDGKLEWKEFMVWYNTNHYHDVEKDDGTTSPRMMWPLLQSMAEAETGHQKNGTIFGE